MMVESTSKPLRPTLLVVTAVLLVGIGVLLGVSLTSRPKHTANEALKASDIGNATAGREIFSKYRCSACHTFEGKGGTDAPALNFMRGILSAKDIAGMAGRIWNHVPMMQQTYSKEKIPFPMFKGRQMADLIAYLHGGGPPPIAIKMNPSSPEQNK